MKARRLQQRFTLVTLAALAATGWLVLTVVAPAA